MNSRPDQAWLDQLREAPLDPDQPIIDAHHHLWLERADRGFPYPIEELAGDVTSGHKVIATVCIQCGTHYRKDGPEHLRSIGETEWVDGAAEAYARKHPDGPALCTAFVGHVDLRRDPGLVDEALQAHQAASRRFRGIRQSSTWSDDPEISAGRKVNDGHLYLDPAFRRGFSRLARQGLSFDAYLFHPQLADLVDLARSFPDTLIVMDHLGTPLGQGRYAATRDAVFREWRRSIDELARCPNVHVKLGGAAMPMLGFHWDRRASPPSSDEQVEATGHFFKCLIDAFSPSRCMFESNFPVDKLGCGYVPLWNSFKKMAASFSAHERADLFGGTASRFYRLGI